MNTIFRAAQQTRMLTIFLIAAMLLSCLPGMRVNAYSNVTTVTTCPQAKAEQARTTRTCQFALSLTAILEKTITFILSLTGKLSFLFVTALVTAGFNDRLYKPPRSFASI